MLAPRLPIRRQLPLPTLPVLGPALAFRSWIAVAIALPASASTFAPRSVARAGTELVRVERRVDAELVRLECRVDAELVRVERRVDAELVRVERRVDAMGTELSLAIDAPTRAEALAASEAAVRAIEVVERRLSTWGTDGELAAFDRAAVGARVELSPELARELATTVRWSRATDGAFDPAVGALVRAWDLRGTGRVPEARERDAAIVPGGIRGALALDGRTAVRRDPRLVLEEGGFGKGAGLDAALDALAGTSALGATLDFGGQIAFFARNANDRANDHAIEIADPRDRRRAIATLRTSRASAATSANSEHARVVGGRTIGHLLDPRTGEPAPDFGSVTVLADRALDADCLSTGLFVLGPERALAFADAHGVDVLVVEVLASGALRLRASPGVAARVELLDADVRFEREPAPAHDRTPSGR